MSNILVTGADGFIGTHLVKKLTSQDNNVFGCDLIHSRDINYNRCDIAEYRQLHSLFRAHLPQIDMVFNLAGEFGRSNGNMNYEQLWKTNVIGMRNILELQQLYNFKLIHFSSSEIYGDYRGIMKESVPLKHSLHLLNDYAISKSVNEQQIRNAINMERQIVTVRLFNIYGPGEYYSPYRSAMAIFCYCALKNRQFTAYMSHSRVWLYIDDLIKTLVNIPGNFKSGSIYNIGGNKTYYMDSLAELVLKYTNASSKLLTLIETEPLAVLHKRVDCSLAKKELGHNPTTSIELGIKQTLRWMKEVYGGF